MTDLWIGGEDIVANIRRNLESAVSVHHAHMPEIEITSPTTAKGIWAMQDLLCFAGGVKLIGSGHYIEGYEKQSDGKWRLKAYQLTRLRVDIEKPPAGEPVPGPKLHPERTINAALVSAYGGPDKISYETVPEPIAGPGEILVKVAGRGDQSGRYQAAQRQFRHVHAVELSRSAGRRRVRHGRGSG